MRTRGRLTHHSRFTLRNCVPLIGRVILRDTLCTSPQTSSRASWSCKACVCFPGFRLYTNQSSVGCLTRPRWSDDCISQPVITSPCSVSHGVDRCCVLHHLLNEMTTGNHVLRKPQRSLWPLPTFAFERRHEHRGQCIPMMPPRIHAAHTGGRALGLARCAHVQEPN
jgi:hypothetical protein